MRIPTSTTVALVLLAGVVGYYLGVKNRTVEPDAWGLASASVAFSTRYDCETVVDNKTPGPGCEPLTFAQAHRRGFDLIPVIRGEK